MIPNDQLRGFLRSVGVTTAILLLPVLLGNIFGSIFGWLNFGFSILIGWVLVVYPHGSLVFRDQYQSTAVFHGNGAVWFALCQWFAVVLGLAWFTRAKRPSTQIVISLVAVLIVGILTHLLARAVGARLELDLP